MDKIPLEVRSLIRSSINIRSYVDAISELIYNSLDADATSIAVGVDLVKHKIQIVDNGQGITVDNMKEVGRRHMTSKCKTLHDLKYNVKTFGFRGEAISSIVNISEKVVIDSLYFKGDKTYSKVFYKGMEDGTVFEIKMRSSHGTTITITNFLYNLGVCQKSINCVHEMEEIHTSISKIALLHHYVSFTLRDDADGKLVLKTHKSCSVREASGYLFDQTIGNTLVPVKIDNDRYSIEGYISKLTHVNKTFQYVYVNKRYVKNCDMKKLCNDLLCEKYGLHLMIDKDNDKKSLWPNFKRSFNERKYPVFIMNIVCPQSEYDITCMPDKSIIQFKHVDRVQETVKMLVREYIRKIKNDGGVVEKTNDNKTKKRKTNDKMPKNNTQCALKEILDKNVEEFGASQMYNAVKGNPAKRIHNFKSIKEVLAYPSVVIKPTCTFKEKSVECVATPKQKIKITGMNCHKIRRKAIGKIGNKIKSSLDVGSEGGKTMRETPFILSQICKAKGIVKSKEFNNHKGIKKTHKDVAVNVNILSRKVQHLKTRIKDNNCYSSVYQNDQIFVRKTKGNNNYYEKTTQSSIVHHMNYDSHKNFHLANINEKKFNSINNHCIPVTNEIISGCDIDQHLNQMLTKNDLRDIYNMLRNEFMNKQERNEPSKKRFYSENYERPINKAYDMIRTIIPEKQIEKNMNISDVAFSSRNYTFDDEKQLEIPKGVMCTNGAIYSKQLKNSAVQTVLNLDDIEAMIQKCDQITRDAINDNSTKDMCLYHSVPNMRLHWTNKSSTGLADNRIDTERCKSSVGKEIDNLIHCETSPFSDQRRNIDITSFTCVNNDVSVHFRTSGSSNRDNNDYNIDPNDFLEIVQINANDASKENIAELNIIETGDIENIDAKNSKRESRTSCNKRNTGEKVTERDEIRVRYDEENNAEKIRVKIHEENIKVGHVEDVAIKSNKENNEVRQTEKDIGVRYDKENKIEDIVKEIVINETAEDYSSKNYDIDDENDCIMLDKHNILSDDGGPTKQTANLYDNHSTKSGSKSLSMFKSADLDVEFVVNNSTTEGNEFGDKNAHETSNNKRKFVSENNDEINEILDSGSKKLEIRIQDNNVEKNGEVFEVVEILGEKSYSNHVHVTTDDSNAKLSPANEANEWEVKTDSLGKVFYMNNRTGMTLYENPTHDSTSGYKVYKRPSFVPKGLSPILKLGQANWEYGNRLNNEETLTKARNDEAEILAKIKHGNFYYTDEAYENFASGLRENNFSEFLGGNNVGKPNLLHHNSKRFKPNSCFRFDKEMLQDVEVVNQVDKKFICATVVDYVREKKYILLFDQHAVHERVQLEKLISEFRSNAKWKSMCVSDPIRLSVNAHNLPLLKKYKEDFENIGLTYTWNSMNKSEIDITGLPSCFQYTDLNEEDGLLKLVNNMICEELDVMKSTKGSCSRIPATIMKVISSKACHSAIKFGASLSRGQCTQLLNELSTCDVPFQCAHGRPTLTILLAEDINKQSHAQVKKLNFKNIKKHWKNL